MPQCKLCGSLETKLARCHIYPRALARIAAGNGPLIGLSDIDGEIRLTRADAGLYDRDIVCQNCERRFKRADDYALAFRRRALKMNPPFELPHKTLAFPSVPANGALLHEFALTTLLRAHLSERREMSQVNHPEVFQEAKDSLSGVNKSIAKGRQVSVVVTRGSLGEMAASPTLHALSDHPLFELRLPNIAFFVAATDAGLPAGFSEIALRHGPNITFWRRKWPLQIELLEVSRRFEAVGARTDRIMRQRFS